MELSRGLESAANNSKKLKPLATAAPQETVRKVTMAEKDGGVICHRCGGKGHKTPSCCFKNAKCHHCGKVGHLKKVCRSKGKPARGNKHPVCTLPWRGGVWWGWGIPGTSSWFRNKFTPVKVNLIINEQPLCMEVDTGVAPLIISETTFHLLWPTANLSPSNVRLCTYSGEALSVLGTVSVCVQYKEQSAQLPLLVVQGKGLVFSDKVGCNDWQVKRSINYMRVHCTPC